MGYEARRRQITIHENKSHFRFLFAMLCCLMRHSLFKYYDQRTWAENFLKGEMLFRSLSYFRDCENPARGDEYESTSTFLPDGGLKITNHTQGTHFTIPWSFESSVKSHEVFVFCASRRFGYDLVEEFNSVVCVEVTKIAALLRADKSRIA
jgi:hypothetical protein